MSRVVIVQNSIKTTYIFRLAYIRELLKSSQVVVIAPNDDIESRNKLVQLGVEVYEIPPFDTATNKIRAIFLMNLFIIKERCNPKAVFICHFLVTFILTYFSLIPFNKRVIIYTEGLGSIFAKKAHLRLILRIFLTKNQSLRLFCNSSERDAIGLSCDVVTNGVGIDLHRFTPVSKKIKSEKFQLLYVGRLVRDKGFLDAVFVLDNLISKGYDVCLNVVGDLYPSNPTSISESDKINLERKFQSNINFVGFSNRIEDWYQQSSLLILPSIREGFPVCVMEASAMGVPTIGYNVPGMNDAVKPGVNGFLANFHDRNDLSSLVEKNIDSKSLGSLSLSSSLYAKENFCQINKNRQLLELISSLNKN